MQKEGKLKKRKGSKENDDGKGSRVTRWLIEGHSCLVVFVYENDNNVVSQRLVEKLKLPTSFNLNQARIKFSIGQVWKKYYVILLPRTHFIFWDGYGFILKRSILMNVPLIWGMMDIKGSRNLWHQDKHVRINIGWRRK